MKLPRPCANEDCGKRIAHPTKRKTICDSCWLKSMKNRRKKC